MATIINQNLQNFLFDVGHDPKVLGRLKLPYKTFNFLALLSRNFGSEKYDRAVEIIELCHWMYNHVADIRNVINRLAEYVITDIQIDNTSTELSKEQQETLVAALEKVKLKSKLVELAKYYFATGNAFCSVEVRFKKHLQCKGCKSVYPIDKINYIFDKKTIGFKAKCDSCGAVDNMTVIDVRKRNIENVYIKIWDWHDIEFTFNPIVEEYRYYYKIPKSFLEKLLNKNPDQFILETTPQDTLIQIFSNKRNGAIGFLPSQKGRVAAFKDGQLMHMRQPSIMTYVMEGWGEPSILGVMQDTFFMLLLRQAQATLLADYILPIRIVSPDPAAVNMTDLRRFAEDFDRAYDSFQKDPMQIFKFPYPIQYQTVSGEAKQLFLSNEMDYTRQVIRRGMGLPADLLDGDMKAYSAGSIQLRMLENYFLNFVSNTVVDLVNGFLIPKIAAALGLPEFKCSMAKFKMIDDVQQKEVKLNLYDRNLIPDVDVYETFGMPKPSENELIESIERRAKRDGTYQKVLSTFQADAQGILAEKQIQSQFKIQDMQAKEQSVQQAKANDSKNQAMTQTPLTGNPGPVFTASGEVLPPAEIFAQELMGQLQSPQEINNAINELQMDLPNNPEYVQQVSNMLNNAMAQQTLQQTPEPGLSQEAASQPSQVDMRPVPEQKPQRRESQV